MAIQLMDNFQFYGFDEAKMLQSWWSEIYSGAALVDDPDTNADADSKAFRTDQSPVSTVVCRLAVPTAGQQMGVACRLWFAALPSSSTTGGGIQWNDGSNNPLYMLRVTATGSLVLTRRHNGGASDWSVDNDVTVEAGAGPVVGAGAWYHIEWYMDTATGDYEVRVEGVTVLSGTDASHHTANLSIFVPMDRWETTSPSQDNTYIKDLVIWDDTGTQNTTFIGPVTVYSLQVDGDVSGAWVPSIGATQFGVMDELTPDDADYATAGDPAPAAAVMTFEDVPADVVAIRAAMTVVRAWKTDGGDATMQTSLVSNAALDDGSDDAMLTSVRFFYDVSELDPNTAAAWTPAGLNAAQIKLNRTL